MTRLAVAWCLALVLGLFGGAVEAVLAGDPGGGPLKFKMGAGGITWEDYQGETAYRVSGYISYHPEASCGPPAERLTQQRVDFSEELAANTRTFIPPGPADSRLTWSKEGSITVEAIDTEGNILAGDGSAWVGDKFCTPEEIAAAGTGFMPDRSADRIIPAAALVAFGGVCLAVSILLRRKAA